MKELRLFLFALLIPGLAAAQDRQWLPGGQYDSEVPTPRAALGYEIGDWLTDHLQMVDYIRRLEMASDRVRVIPIGQSVERRGMYLVIVSSPANLAKLEETRAKIARLTDPRRITEAEAAAIINDTPPIGWMNFANDGGETAAFEAGILLAWQLAAGTDPLTLKILDNVVTIINPAANPDSHQAFATWMKAATVGENGSADPEAAEHHVPWFISSDGNHYLIDSNRDAFALTQVETQAIARQLHHWNPQVWIDNHGEPNEYYFAPFTAPMNLNYPSSLREWATEIGRNTARHFDRFGWSYAKDETYDIYYPGYWDSYPALNGAVAATYETNGGGWKNLSWEKPDGTLSTLRGAVHAHFIADLATLETLAERRREILRYFYDFFAKGMEEADGERFKTYALLPGPDPGRTKRLVQLLMRHQIEVYQTTREIAADSAQSYFDRQSRSLLIPAGSYLIPLKQPRKRMIKTFLEADPKIEDSFLREVEAARRRNAKLGERVPKEGLGFYDVTAWTLPLAFGVDTVFTESELGLDGSAKLTEAPGSEGGAPGEPAAYAYLFGNHRDAGAKLAGKLLQEGYRVAISTRPFENDGNSFPAGTFIARVERNPESLHGRISELSRSYGTEVFTSSRAWSETGVSLGSRRIVDLEAPRIAVMSDEPTRAVAFGSVYSLLEQRFDLRFTAIRADYFEDVDLGKYNVIIFPDGSARGYLKLLGESGVKKLESWIRGGGVLIGIGAGAEFAAMEEAGLTDVRAATRFERKTGDGGEMMEIEPLAGSIFRVTVNNDYYLGYGQPETIAVQVRGRRLLSPSKLGANVAAFPEKAHLVGHLWETTEEALAGKVYLADVPVGAGRAVLFADDPTFRAYWQGLDRLVVNAVLLGPSF